MLLASIPFPNIDPVLLHIWGPLALRWYSLSYIAMLLLGWWYIARLLREKALWTNPPFNGKPPATADDIGDLVVWVTLGVILGGRLGWVIFYGTILCSVTPGGGMCHGLPGEFLTNPVRIISAWDGGMSFHGGLIGVVAALLLFAHRRRMDPFRIGDLLAVAAPIGMFLVRLANFINGELWGTARPTCPGAWCSATTPCAASITAHARMPGRRRGAPSEPALRSFPRRPRALRHHAALPARVPLAREAGGCSPP